MGEKNGKMSYEELENFATQLSEQARQMQERMMSMNLSNMFKRIEFLFKVIENKDSFNKGFYDKCVKEIEELMTVPEEETKEK